MMTVDECKRKIADLDAKIEAYPYWGAVLTVWDEERRGLKRSLHELVERADRPAP
jgi:hypothetical protein